MRFIEDNWLGGQRIGKGSFDGIAGSIGQMFSFDCSTSTASDSTAACSWKPKTSESIFHEFPKQ
jgi:hypothetical protein